MLQKNQPGATPAAGGPVGHWLSLIHRLAEPTSSQLKTSFIGFFAQKNHSGFLGFIALVFLLAKKLVSIGKKPSLACKYHKFSDQIDASCALLSIAGLICTSGACQNTRKDKVFGGGAVGG